MKKRVRAFTYFFALLTLFFSFQVSIKDVSAVETGLNATASNAGYNTNVSVQQYIGFGIQAVLGVAGAVFFAIIVYGGILWMISEGEQAKVKKARDTMTYAGMGLIVVLGAYALTSFITTQIAGKVLN